MTNLSSLPTPITEAGAAAPTVVDLVARRASLKADAEYIADQIQQIDAQLIAALGTVGTHTVGDTKVQIREYSRTDFTRLAERYPVDQYPDLYVTKTELNQTVVRKQFAPAALDEFKVVGARSVVIP